MIVLENIINKILEIDEKAVSIKKETEETLRNNEKELKKALDELEKDIMSDASEQAEKEYNAIIREAKESAERIAVKGNAKYSKLDDAFSRIEEELEGKIFNKLFSKPT